MAQAARNDMHQDERQPAVVLPLRLIVRCFAECKGDQWQAFTLEFGLAAQGESYEEVRHKLESMIDSYVREALTEDREHAKSLLARKGSWQVYAKFYLYRILRAINGRTSAINIFDESLDLEPRHCPA